MLRIPQELQGARVNVTRAAEICSMDLGHFRRLIRREVFPPPRRTSKGMPFFDYELLTRIGQVLKSGVGISGEEIVFYRRTRKQSRPSQKRPKAEDSPPGRGYLADLIRGCGAVGIDESLLDPARVTEALKVEFQDQRPPLATAIPVIARRLLGGEG